RFAKIAGDPRYPSDAWLRPARMAVGLIRSGKDQGACGIRDSAGCMARRSLSRHVGASKISCKIALKDCRQVRPQENKAKSSLRLRSYRSYGECGARAPRAQYEPAITWR